MGGENGGGAVGDRGVLGRGVGLRGGEGSGGAVATATAGTGTGGGARRGEHGRVLGHLGVHGIDHGAEHHAHGAVQRFLGKTGDVRGDPAANEELGNLREKKNIHSRLG